MQSLMLCLMTLVAQSAATPDKMMMFEDFMKQYDRHYSTEFEKGQRYQIFSENVDQIYASNARNHTYKLGITKDADKTWEEFRAGHLTGFRPSLKTAKGRARFSAPEGFTVPESVDWVSKGGVTSVKNQGTCGSCWTFSTVGALEGAMFVAGRTLTNLSMQQILACDTGGSGCSGGSMDQAFGWVEKNGIPSLATEPYLCVDASSSSCTSMKCTSSDTLVLAAGDVKSYTDVEESESALEAAVAQQPVSVAIEADQSVFQHYVSGVLTSTACGSSLDHGVLVVGYGEDNGQKYWKVKNSWGESWGESGYIRIERGSTSSGGECGIREMASFPVVKSTSQQVIV